MHLFEKLAYTSIPDPEEKENPKTPEDLAEEARKRAAEIALIRATGLGSDGKRYWRIQESVSNTPRAPGVLYAQNKRYLDICTPFENKRGLITTLALFFVPVVVSSLQGFFSTAGDIYNGFGAKGTPFSTIDYILWSIPIPFLLAPSLLFLFLAYKFFRIEILVQRRVIARFDRIHRKVHLHRPGFGGGVVSLAWDKILVYIPKEGERSNAVLWLAWEAEDSPNKHEEDLMLGHMTKTENELADFWEYIRRFMEHGPKTLPRERLRHKIPWPWYSIWMAYETVSAFSNPLITILFSPALLFFAAMNWLSLLLCWEPVFPRKIRKACGESHLVAIIEARFIDLLAWSMLAGVLWWLWPTLTRLFE